MKRLLMISLLAVLTATALSAQDKEYKDPKYSPKAGDWSIGASFNPASLAYKISLQPKPETAVGEFINALGENPKQMFILSQDPLAAFRFRYVVNPNWLVKVSLGFNGSNINYREYVQDDLAVSLNPDSQNKVVDQVTSNLFGMSLSAGAQYMAGKGPLRFLAGFGLTYVVAGGGINFRYGNGITDLNKVPSSMPMTNPGTPSDPTLNDFKSELGIAYGRPVKRYNVGYNHGIGINAEMGIEWFMTGRLSLGATMTFTPVMFLFQPQTYTVYEGFSSLSGKVESFNGLVSPGSDAVLYGTENLGLNISVNYFF